MRYLIFIVLILYGEFAMALTLTSSAFKDNQSIPAIYTCKGNDISPPLAWSDVPKETKSFALIMDDPDAPVGNWDHWILFNLPASTTSLDESATLPANTAVLKNSWGKREYGGPCPPSGTHHYVFKLYALDAMLDPQTIANKAQLVQAIQEHLLAETKLIGLVQH